MNLSVFPRAAFALTKWRLPEATGEGRPVVFLHGTLSHPLVFQPVLRSLQRPFYAPHYGNAGTASIDEMVEELDASLPQEDVDVVGHSLGGFVGLQLAQRTTRRIRRLIGLGAPWHGVSSTMPGWLGGAAYTDLEAARYDKPEVPEGVEVISVVSDKDTVVPPDPLGKTIWLKGVSHSGLAQQTTLIRRLLR